MEGSQIQSSCHSVMDGFIGAGLQQKYNKQYLLQNGTN